MPRWALNYLVILGAVTVMVVVIGIRSCRSWRRILGDVLAALCMGLFFASFWHSSVLRTTGLLGVAAFILALGWEMWTTWARAAELRAEGRVKEPAQVVVDWAVSVAGIAAIWFGYVVAGLSILRHWVR